jgi:thermitase
MKRSLAAAAAVGLTLALAPSAFGAGAEYVPGEVVVKYADDATAAQKSAAQELGGVIDRIAGVSGVGAHLVGVTGSVQAAIARLESSPAVEYAEPNYIYRADAIPNDPLFGQMYGLDNTGQTGGTADADIDAPEGWDAGGLGAFPTTGGAKVGIVDTGIQLDHPDLAGKTVDCAGVNKFGINLGVVLIGSDPTIVSGKCADNNGHGTHVAGTIAANSNNGVGVAGVSPSSPLAICKALNGSGSGTLVMVANCIDWTNQRGAKVISMSLGSTAGAATLQQAVQRATNNGSLVIAAAGNGGNSTVNYPAGYPEVVSVAATDHNDARASFSTFNSDVEVAAPGVDIVSTWNDGAYNTISGTSMATPHASGVAAVIATQRPTLTVAQLRAKLDSSVDDRGTPGRDPQFGFGRVNLLSATTGP